MDNSPANCPLHNEVNVNESINHQTLTAAGHDVLLDVDL